MTQDLTQTSRRPHPAPLGCWFGSPPAQKFTPPLCSPRASDCPGLHQGTPACHLPSLCSQSHGGDNHHHSPGSLSQASLLPLPVSWTLQKTVKLSDALLLFRDKALGTQWHADTPPSCLEQGLPVGLPPLQQKLPVPAPTSPSYPLI